MLAAERLDVFAPFLKKERDADGILWVEGKFTGPDLDSDGQRMDPTWLRSSAVPGYMRGPSGGNVREGHSAQRPIGKAVEVWETDDGSWHMRAKIVDDAAAKKIEHGVLAGLSVGIANPVIVKAADAPNGCCAGGTMIEVSAVDRPALPSATLRIAGVLDKAAGSLELVEDPALEEDLDAIEKAAEGDVIARPQMLLKTSDGQVRPMTAALVDELTAPTVVANPDDPDAADPEALEKAKKGKKAPPFAADDKPQADDDSGDDSDDEDADDGKKPATKAADVDIEALVKSLVAAELAKRDGPAAVEPAPVVEDAGPVEKDADPDVTKGVGVDDELDDIARARRVMDDIAVLIQSEAAGFRAGIDAEVWDLEMLINVLGMLQCFVQRETEEAAAMAENTPDSGATDTTPAPAVIQLSAQPDIMKAADKVAKKLRKRLDKAAAAAAAANTPPVEGDQTAVEPDVAKAASTTDTETLTKAVADKVTADLTVQLGDVLTKAMGPVIDRVAEVETLLKSTPRPGGPAVTRVQPAVSPAESVERAEKAQKANILKGMLAANPAGPMRAALVAQLAELEPNAA